MNILNIDWRKNKVYFYLLIIIVAFILRVILFLQPANRFLGGNDAIGYHNAAVNIVNGENNFGFFREPGYIYFIAGIYKIWEIGGGSINSINSQFLDVNQNPEILFLILVQMLLNVISIVFFYKTIAVFLQRKHSLIITLLVSVYVPYATISLYLLRECLQFFIIILSNYYFLLYVKSKRLFFLVPFAFLWGVSNLILKTTFYFLPFYIIFILFINRFSIRKIISAVFISMGIMVLVITPYLNSSYNTFNDIRVLKSMGTSFTFESRDYAYSLYNLYRFNIISKSKYDSIIDAKFHLISDNERFAKSFNGYYKQEADSLNSVVSKYQSIKDKLKDKIYSFVNVSWLRIFWTYNSKTYQNPLSVSRRYLPFVFISLLFGYISIIGLIIWFKKCSAMLLYFTFFITLIPIIGDETRRIMIIHPFLIMFSYMFLIFLYYRLVKRLPTDIANQTIFNNDPKTN